MVTNNHTNVRLSTEFGIGVAITLSKLKFGYPGRPLVLNIDQLEVQSGTMVSILGPSGCGKTTLLLLIAGLLTPMSGRIAVLGKAASEVRRHGFMGVVFQNPTLLPWRTVAGNLSLPFELQGKAVDRDILERTLSLVGLDEFGETFPDELSGGMQSRVALARALVTKPEILLLDEAFGNLDEFNRLRLNLALSDIQKRLNTTVLFVTHNVHDAVLISDRILLLQQPESIGRPAIVDEDIKIDFPNKSVESMSNEEFQTLYQRLVSLFRQGANR